jgi:hypothetical protein
VKYNMDNLITANQKRHTHGAALQVEQAAAAIPHLKEMAVKHPKRRRREAAVKWFEAAHIRVIYPHDTLTQIAARLGLTKDEYWAILRRGITAATHPKGMSQ